VDSTGAKRFSRWLRLGLKRAADCFYCYLTLVSIRSIAKSSTLNLETMLTAVVLVQFFTSKLPRCEVKSNPPWQVVCTDIRRDAVATVLG
jgi:hypothetical protein